MKLNVKSFALTIGIFLGIGLFIISWWVIIFDGQGTDLGLLAKVYRGYSATPLGSFIGLAWGAIDGILSGAIIASLYNKLIPNNL